MDFLCLLGRQLLSLKGQKPLLYFVDLHESGCLQLLTLETKQLLELGEARPEDLLILLDVGKSVLDVHKGLLGQHLV
jgi:hypothetical protein